MARRPHLSVAQNRTAPPKGLDFWPTPHWVTRAMVRYVLGRVVDLDSLRHCRAIDPCCGEGAMVEALLESFGYVSGGDVFPYDWVRHHGTEFDFAGPDSIPAAWEGADWYFFNPPFNAAEEFIVRALDAAGRGVIVLHRPGLWQNPNRFRRLWSQHPPTIGALFAERCNLVPGRLDPNGTTGRDYVVSVWVKGVKGATDMMFIPPCRAELERPEDYPEWPLSVEDTPLLCMGALS